MKREDIEKIKRIIGMFSIIGSEKIREEDNLIELGIDSLKTVELIIALEDILDISFNEYEFAPEKIKSVKDIINLTEKYMIE